MLKRIGYVIVYSIILCCLPSVTMSLFPAEQTGNAPILDTKSFWRVRMTVGTDRVRLKSGELIYYGGRKTIKRHREWEVKKAENPRCWGEPAENWNASDFEDSGWAVFRGPFGIRRFKSIPNIFLRGKFRVTGSAKAGNLHLSVTYQGGIIVYLNGKEVLRAHMPDGEITPRMPAEDYPLDVYVDEKGHLRGRSSKKEAKNRKVSVEISADKLRKGINVLAIAIHRAPAHETFYTSSYYKGKQRLFKPKHLIGRAWWSRCGLVSLKLTSGDLKNAVPNAGHTGRPQGLQIWSEPAYSYVTTASYCSSEECLSPVYVYGAKNGVYSGKIIVGSERPIQGLKAEASVLQGPGVIQKSCIRIRYSQRYRNSFIGGRHSSCGLEESPPETVQAAGNGAVQPIWVTVHVPKDAKPGDYTGTVTVTANGNEPGDVPVHLHVVDWTMPDPSEYTGFLDLIQSPESVAMYYNVPLWSDKHWKLLERTFSVLRAVGNKTLYITGQRKTHFGNDHAMIRFIKETDGTYTPDLSIAEKYIDMAVNQIGRIPVIGVCAWRPPWRTGHYGKHQFKDHPIVISVINPKTGNLKKENGPQWGTPECRAFWKPVFDGMKKIAKKHGLESSLMIGMSSDYMPTDKAVNDLKSASGGLKWIHHSHVVRNTVGAKVQSPMGYIAAGWGGHTIHHDPSSRRGYGWKNPLFRAHTRAYPRGMLAPRFNIEFNMTSVAKHTAKGTPGNAGLQGYGRIGADFWPVLGSGTRKKYIAARYPETAWGQLSLRCCGTQVIAPGKEGALGTTALEMYRANLQEVEARVFIEKILNDPAKKEKLDTELAEKAQKILDQRTRMTFFLKRLNRTIDGRTILPFIKEYSEALYNVTEEAAQAVE